MPRTHEMGTEEIEVALRREWWMNHGHDYHALYGDDGEMQCSLCPADFKRQPMAELRDVVFAARLAKAAEVSRGSATPPPTPQPRKWAAVLSIRQAKTTKERSV